MSTEGISLKTLVFLDFESTGMYTREKVEWGHRESMELGSQNDYSTPRRIPGNIPRITEWGMIAYSLNHINSSFEEGCGEPRCGEKMLFQVNPQLPRDEWSPGSSKISGLSQDMLEKKRTLKERWPEVMNFLNTCVEKPACIIAHNGRGFDFRLLKDEIRRLDLEDLPDEIYVADSIDLIRQLENTYRQDLENELRKINSPKSGNDCPTNEDEEMEENVPEQEEEEFVNLLTNLAGSSMQDASGEGSDLNRYRVESGANEETPLKKRPAAAQGLMTSYMHRSQGLQFHRSPVRLPMSGEWAGKLIPQIIRYCVNGENLRTEVVDPDPPIPLDRIFRPKEDEKSPFLPPSTSPKPQKEKADRPTTSRASGPTKRKLDFHGLSECHSPEGASANASVQSGEAGDPGLPALPEPEIDTSTWSPAKRKRVGFERSEWGAWRLAKKG